MRYRSVIGYGIASFVEDLGEKRAALDVIMRQYTEETHEYSDESLRKTAVIKVEIREISGEKIRGLTAGATRMTLKPGPD